MNKQRQHVCRICCSHRKWLAFRGIFDGIPFMISLSLQFTSAKCRQANKLNRRPRPIKGFRRYAVRTMTTSTPSSSSHPQLLKLQSKRLYCKQSSSIRMNCFIFVLFVFFFFYSSLNIVIAVVQRFFLHAADNENRFLISPSHRKVFRKDFIWPSDRQICPEIYFLN